VTVTARNESRAGEGAVGAAAPPGEEEADLLDFLGAASGTRLACQLRLGRAFDHADVALPGPSPLGDAARPQPEAS
jgi:hypothetical protein